MTWAESAVFAAAAAQPCRLLSLGLPAASCRHARLRLTTESRTYWCGALAAATASEGPRGIGGPPIG
jgi:hypothetical protein